MILSIKEHRDDILVDILLLVTALFVFGLPTLILALACCKYLKSYRTSKEYAAFGLVSVLGFGVGVLNLTSLPAAVGGEFTTIIRLVSSPFFLHEKQDIRIDPFVTVALSTLPLAPLLGAAMGHIKRLQKMLRLNQTTDEWLEHSQEREQDRQRNLERLARQRAEKEPRLNARSELSLGTLLHGDTLPTLEKESIGIHQRGNWIVLEDDILNQHLFVLGATGAGKSTALVRLCAEVLKNTDRDLIVIDGKGEEQLAQDIRALVWKYRGHETPIFRLGGIETGARYHAFCGHADAIYNRLLKMIDDGKAEGGATWYLDKNRNLLQLICTAPCGPPRDFAELRARLSLKWLADAWRDDPDELEYIMHRKQEDMESISERLLPLIRELKRVISSDGFTLEDTRSAVFSIKTLAIGDTAKRFCRFVIEDFKDFVTNRAKRRGALGIDEFGVFGNENIRDLLSQARSKEYAVALLTQDYANLGDDNLARQILANTLTKVLMGTDYPEELGTPAGTKYQIESSVQSNELGPTGMMSGRIQHAFKVDMNTARRFQNGQSFVIRKGYAVAVQISRVELEKELGGLSIPSEVPLDPQIQQTASEPLIPPHPPLERPKKERVRRKTEL